MMKEIHLKRTDFKDTYTLGRLTIEGVGGFFPTIEDVVRPEGQKVWGETAIPAGRYRVVLNEVSPKFSKYPFYVQICKGRLPRLVDVPGFQGVLIHCGRTERNTAGCILLNRYGAPITESKEYFRLFYDAIKDEEDLWITIE